MSKRRKKDLRDERVELKFLEGVQRRIGDEPDLLKAMGDLYTTVGLFDEGLAMDLKLAKLCPEEPLVWYNLGCSLALLKRTDEALEALDRAIHFGYEDGQWMRKDSDLKSLHGDKRFETLLKKIAE